MAYSTRSQSSRSEPDPSLECFSQEEVKVISQKLSEKDKRLREQSESIREREEVLRQKEIQLEEKCVIKGDGNRELEQIKNMLANVQKEFLKLRNLPDQVNSLQRIVNNITIRPANPSEVPENEPIENENLLDSDYVPIVSPIRQENSPIRLKDLVDSIPRFDGHRISVFQFSKICERTLKLIPHNQESVLVQLIISKLQGHAYTAIDGSEFSTVSSLTRRLKEVFGPNKSLDQYRGELGNVYMKHNENVFDYIERVKDLKTAIIDGEVALRGYLDDYFLYEIDKNVLTSFINGLPSDLLIRVKLEGYDSFDDAIMKAVQIQKTMEIENLRQKSTFYQKSQISPRADIPQLRPKSNQNTSQDFQPLSILRRPNQAPGDAFVKPLIPGQPGPNAPQSQPVCHYCKAPGHFIADCQKLAYKRKLGENSGLTSRPVNNLPSGNATRVSVDSGVRRDVNQTVRPIQSTVVTFKDHSDPKTSVQ